MKISKHFRLEEEVLVKMDKLVELLSAEIGIKLDRTKLIEKLITDKYESRKEVK